MLAGQAFSGQLQVKLSLVRMLCKQIFLDLCVGIAGRNAKHQGDMMKEWTILHPLVNNACESQTFGSPSAFLPVLLIMTLLNMLYLCCTLAMMERGLVTCRENSSQLPGPRQAAHHISQHFTGVSVSDNDEASLILLS
jgi:hypothetical protein